MCSGGSVGSIQVAHALARMSGLSLYPLGQGSNVLAGDAPIDAIILKMENDQVSFTQGVGGSESTNEVEVVADAGVSWDELVRACAARALWGVENLAGIPGTAGAAPVQNIGAYGAELADTFAWAECYDTTSDTVARLTKDECSFGYRESRFKHEPNLIIMRVALRLSKVGFPKTRYADLTRRIDSGEILDTPEAVGEAVRAIRRKKFPDLTQFGTAGSFFKNPTIAAEQFTALQARYPELPGFVVPAGVKVSLAWILDHVLDLRGFRMGAAHLFQNQPLVLVADEGATARDVDTLANAVCSKVFDATGITIEREVRSLS